MTTPTDTFYGLQWHFNNIGDIESIWDEYTGLGINIGVYDDGIDTVHEDLFANYDASLEVVDDNGNTVAPMPETSTDGHGTSVAGLIAADDNGTGVVGVAHGASLTGVNILGANTYGYANGDQMEFHHVVSQATNFDIMSNSWGATPLFFSSGNLGDINSRDSLLNEEYRLLSENGRNGLGTIIAQAAGNDDLDSNGGGINASRFTITVAATFSSGVAASYSNFGQSILVAAPAGSVTTDITDGGGYNTAPGGDPGEISDDDYTQNFGGTSAATPVVSGIIALMLEANGNLGWRDVQNILANSAVVTGDGSDTTVGTNEDGVWFINNADNWNGGGMHFHVNYGYGMIDVHGAVRLAEAWAYFDVPQTSANEINVTTAIYSPAGGLVIPDNNSTGVTFSLLVTQNVEVEHVGLYLDITHTYVGNLHIELTSAEGTTIVVKDIEGLSTDVSGYWYYGIDSLLGEDAYGTWTITVSDLFGADSGTIYNAYLEVFGSTPDVDDIYTYNNEITFLLTCDPSRLTLSDTNGGTDWLNFASITLDLIVDIATNGTGTATMDGTTIVNIASGTEIENVHGGDGDDQITGNSLDNEIVGARGDDELNGAQGDDIIYAGIGDDELKGGFGDDIFIGGEGDDRIYGHSWGGEGDTSDIDTVIYDGDFSDYKIDFATYTNSSRTGDTIRYLIEDQTGGGSDGVDEGLDKLLDIDFLQFADITLNIGPQNIGTSSNDNITGTDEYADFMIGLSGKDHLKGKAGNDFIHGGEGDDQIYGYSWGSAGDDADIDIAFYDGIMSDYTISRASYTNSSRSELAVRYFIEDQADGGADGVDEGWDRLLDIDILQFADITIDLNEFKFELAGTSSNNTLTATDFSNDLLLGLAGDDELKGLAGNDFFNGGEGDDKIYGHNWGNMGDAQDIDTVLFDGFIHEYNFDYDQYTNSSRDGIYSTRIFVEDVAAGGGSDGVDEGTDELIDIDVIQFAGGSMLEVDAFVLGDSATNDLVGDLRTNLIIGLAGDDELKGMAGDDFFNGGEGDDKIYGHNWEEAGDASDIDTVIYDGNFSDYNIDFVTYTNSSRSGDTIRYIIEDIGAGGGSDGVDEGLDKLLDVDFLQFADITIHIGPQNAGTSSNENLTGSDQSDFMIGLAGDDELKGMAGNDFFNGGEGDDKIYGLSWEEAGDASDIDTVIYDGNFSDYNIDFVTYTNSSRSRDTIRYIIEDIGAGGGSDGVDEGLDKLLDVDFLQFADITIHIGPQNAGTSSNENLTGSDQSDFMIGLAGDDELKGLAGNDFFNGGEGDDLIYGHNWGNEGDAGDVDTVIYDGNLTDYSFDYDQYSNSSRATSTTRIYVEDDASGGTDGVDEGTDELIDIDVIQFADGNMIDVNAIIFGNSTNDTLTGDARDNIIIGEAGADIMTGNAGLDSFYFNDLSDSTSTDTDTITDFTQGEDTISLFELDVDFADLNITDDGSDTTVGISGTNFEVKLNGAFNLIEDDFLL